MKKMVTRLVALVLCLACVAPVALAADGSDATKERDTETTLLATLTNVETGSMQTIKVKPEIVSIEEKEGTRSYEVSSDVFLPIEVHKERIPVGKDTIDHGVKARICVDYQISSDKETIKVTQVSGGWTPTSSLYLVSNREVGMHCGGIASPRMKKNPTGNSFNYSTGWGYVDFVTSGNGSPYAWADATITVAGMSGSSYRLSLGMYFPDSR